MFFKNKNLNIILALVLIVLVLVFISMQIKTTSRMEGFSGDLINLEKFTPADNIATIKTGISDIQQNLSNGYPDMSKFALKSQIDPQVCRVSSAVDKDAYISKTEADTLSKCPVPSDYEPSRYILKSLAQQPQLCPVCPTIDQSKYVLKSTLPPAQKCPDCKCPQVQVSAGLCQQCPPPPKCPEPKPCPVVECPPPKPCPPQQECPMCPPKEICPPKICPACAVVPTPTECPKCCDRDVIKVLKKTVYVDSTGHPVTEEQTFANTTEDSTGSYGNLQPAPTFGNGLATPQPITDIGTASTSTGGSLQEQSNAGIVDYSTFSKATSAPFIQSFKVKNNMGNNKTCQPNGFNSEFKQFGVYGDNSSRSMFN